MLVVGPVFVVIAPVDGAVVAVVIVGVGVITMMIVVGRSGCRHEGRGHCTEQYT
jgi:hypothetical protein